MPSASSNSFLAQSAVPVIIAPTGSITAGGKITLGTALPFTYDKGAWLYLPAGTISGGAAGCYWTIFGDTGGGGANQVYTNFFDPANAFVPFVPPPLTPLINAVGSGGAFTGVTGEIPLANVTVRAGTLGLMDALNVRSRWAYNSTAGNKIISHKLGSTVVSIATTNTTSTNMGYDFTGRVMGANNKIIWPGQQNDNSATSSTVSIITTGSINSDQTLTFRGNLAAATDFIILEGLSVIDWNYTQTGATN